MCERPADGQGHPACSVMVEGAFGRPLKQPLHGFRDGLLFIAPVVSRVDEKDSPPRSMAESHLTERKRMGIIAKWPFSRTDVLSSQYKFPERLEAFLTHHTRLLHKLSRFITTNVAWLR